MKNLIKYELRKTLSVKLILLAIVGALQILFLIGLWGEIADLTAISIALLTMTVFSGTIIIGLGSVVCLHRDMNTRQGYMLFMTPNSCYRILGAKMIEVSLSILITGAFFFVLGLLDVMLLFSHLNQLDQLWNLFQSFLQQMSVELPINRYTAIALAWDFIASWISVVATAYLADVVASALLNGKKLGGVLSVIFFIAISMGVNAVQRPVYQSMKLIPGLWTCGGIMLVLSVVMAVVTAQIMERKLSV